MAEKPILFSTLMVQAILGNRKSQTRRIVTPQPSLVSMFNKPITPINERGRKINPRYQLSDLLWVKETHHINHTGELVTYKADYDNNHNPFLFDQCGDDCSMVGEKWLPSLFMPKRLARIWLEVTNVKFERLHNLSEKDALAEGFDLSLVNINQQDKTPALTWYRGLWDQINAKNGKDKQWEANPYVWVYEFKRIHKEGNE